MYKKLSFISLLVMLLSGVFLGGNAVALTNENTNQSKNDYNIEFTEDEEITIESPVCADDEEKNADGKCVPKED